eukprot:GHVO01013250.1.p1 GENE.GHVO01013250.1~~GHVO01013250.1.p1  ORF type:complete len:189 (+),score=15.43 GHVO01013250.1:56-622(+)
MTYSTIVEEISDCHSFSAAMAPQICVTVSCMDTVAGNHLSGLTISTRMTTQAQKMALANLLKDDTKRGKMGKPTQLSAAFKLVGEKCSWSVSPEDKVRSHRKKTLQIAETPPPAPVPATLSAGVFGLIAESAGIVRNVHEEIETKHRAEWFEKEMHRRRKLALRSGDARTAKRCVNKTRCLNASGNWE